MKVFWWQCGLHIEPESKEESKALILLVDSLGLNLFEIGKQRVGPSGFRDFSDEKSVTSSEELD